MTITVTLLWNHKKFTDISADRNDIKTEIIKAALKRANEENLPMLRYTKFSKNTNKHLTTELKNILNGDIINVIAESKGNKALENEHMEYMKGITGKNSNFEQALVKKLSDNGFLTGTDREYIVHFFKFHENRSNGKSSGCTNGTSGSSNGISSSSNRASSHTDVRLPSGSGLLKNKGNRNLDEIDAWDQQPRKKKRAVEEKAVEEKAVEVKGVEVGIQCQIAYVNDFEEVKKYLKMYSELPDEEKDPHKFRKFSDMLFDERRAHLMNFALKAIVFKERYPYMCSYEQIVREFELIIQKDNIYSKFESNVKKSSATIINLVPQHGRCRTAKKRINDENNEDERMWLRMAYSLVLLPSCVENNRKEILILKDKDSIPQKCYPYIFCASTSHSLVNKTADLAIVMEGVEVFKVHDILKAYLALFAIHWVFNAEYNPHCMNVFAVLEKFVGHKDPSTEISPVVRELFEKLEQT